MKYKYLFGPVPSRRLGISLGIDLVPHKTCSLNCIYCECGRTTLFTNDRNEYSPLKEIITELDDYLANKPVLDYITFSGSGEPLLHNGIGELVKYIKTNHPDYSIALLTNSVLLGNADVQREIKDIDAVLPSLDAVSEEAFNKINRPCPSIKNSDIINGLINFSNNYKGKIWIEIFIVPGINDNADELKLFKNILNKLKFDKIQLNTLDRPGTETLLKKANYDDLIKIKDFFQPMNVEIISRFKNETEKNAINKNIEDKIKSIIKRRPSTIEDIMNSLGLSEDDVKKNIAALSANEKIEISVLERGTFYKI